MEADPGLIEAAVEKLGLSEAKGAVSPGAKVDGPSGFDIRARRLQPKDLDDPDGEWPGFDISARLDGDRLRLYQSVSALLNYVAFDRPDLLYPIKELMRKMSDPSEADEARLKRAVRYLRTAPRMIARYPWRALDKVIDVFTDSDHAGCPRTRRSTVGGGASYGGDASSKRGRRPSRYWH